MTALVALKTLEANFNAPNDDQGGHPDDLSVSLNVLTSSPIASHMKRIYTDEDVTTPYPLTIWDVELNYGWTLCIWVVGWIGGRELTARGIEVQKFDWQ